MQNKTIFKNFLWRVLPGTITVLLILICWEVVANLQIVPTLLLPTPEAVWNKGVELSISGELARHTFESLIRVLTGFMVASIVALTCAFVFYEWPLAESAAHPVFESLRVIPPLSLVPLLILWLGIDEAPKYAIVILSSFFPVYLTTLEALKRTGKNYLMLALSFSLSRKETFRNILIPGALPQIATGLRLGFGYAWRALVGAELLAASSGLGYLIEDASLLARSDTMLLGIVAIAAWGVTLDYIFTHAISFFLLRKKRKSYDFSGIKKTQQEAQNASSVVITDALVIFGEKKPLDHLNLRINQGEIVSMLGKSGAGKTTLLKVIAGITKLDSGSVNFDGSPTISVVFQDSLLLPWKNVYENIELALLDKPSEVRKERIYEVLTLVGLVSEAESYPEEISGGMAQRVGMARALAKHPDILLMDEPFGALDAITRRQLQEESQKLLKTLGITVLLITHDVREASIMSERVMILKKGKVSHSVEIELAYPRSSTDPAILPYEKRLFEEISQDAL